MTKWPLTLRIHAFSKHFHDEIMVSIASLKSCVEKTSEKGFLKPVVWYQGIHHDFFKCSCVYSN